MTAALCLLLAIQVAALCRALDARAQRRLQRHGRLTRYAGIGICMIASTPAKPRHAVYCDRALRPIVPGQIVLSPAVSS